MFDVPNAAKAPDEGVSHFYGRFRATPGADQGAAGHQVQAEAPQDENGPPPGVLLHQQLEERVKSEGGESDTGQRNPQREGPPAGEVGHDSCQHGGEHQSPAQTWSNSKSKGGGVTLPSFELANNKLGNQTRPFT